jgi:PTS system mannose-specific IIA component
MIGILIVSHRQLGEALIDASEFILGNKPDALDSVSIDINESADKLRKKIADGIKKVDQNQGVLILTDMFGGTPSNLSYSFLEEGRLEVISGVNLPILIKVITLREDMELGKLAQQLEAFGKTTIKLASGILKGNKRG